VLSSITSNKAWVGWEVPEPSPEPAFLLGSSPYPNRQEHSFCSLSFVSPSPTPPHPAAMPCLMHPVALAGTLIS
jgi:hypothetical protein